MSRRTTSPGELHLRVQRLVVDADTLGRLPRDVLLSQVQHAVERRLSGNGGPQREPALAASIGGSVASQVRERVHG